MVEIALYIFQYVPFVPSLVITSIATPALEHVMYDTTHIPFMILHIMLVFPLWELSTY